MEVSALSAYLAGVAALEAASSDTVTRLVTAASGDLAALRDARNLLGHIASQQDQRERSMLLVERAITRVEESRRLRGASQHLVRRSEQTRDESARARGHRIEPDEGH